MGERRRAAPVLTAAPAHQFDDLSLAPGGAGATAAWTYSWFDELGAYHSEAFVADLAHPLRPRVLSAGGQTASGLALAGARGVEVLAFRACDSSGACSAYASFRASHGGFGRPSRLGPIDPSQEPGATVGGDGTAVVGWIEGGRVLAVTRPSRARSFSAARRLSPTVYASELILAPAGTGAVAAWTEGTVSPSLVAATLR